MIVTRAQATIFTVLIVAIFVAATALFHFKSEAEKDSIAAPRWKANAEDINPSIDPSVAAKAQPVEPDNLSMNSSRAKLWAAYPWAMHRGIRSFDEPTLLNNLQAALVPQRMLSEIESKGLALDDIEVSLVIAPRLFEFAPAPQVALMEVVRANSESEKALAKSMFDINKDGLVRFGEVKAVVKSKFIELDRNKDLVINEEDFAD